MEPPAPPNQAGARQARCRALGQVVQALLGKDQATRARALEGFRTTLLPGNQDRVLEFLVAALDSKAEARRRARR